MSNADLLDFKTCALKFVSNIPGKGKSTSKSPKLGLMLSRNKYGDRESDRVLWGLEGNKS